MTTTIKPYGTDETMSNVNILDVSTINNKITDKISIVKIFDSQTVFSWLKDIENWEDEEAQKMASLTIQNVGSGSNIIASVHSEYGLVAITSYLHITSRFRLSMLSDIIKNERPARLERMIINNGVMFVYRLSGAGKGGTRKIIDEIKSESTREKRPIFLNSTDVAKSFYTKMGFKSIKNSNHYYWIQDMK